MAIAIPARMILVALKFLSFEIRKITSVGISANKKARAIIQIEDAIKLPPQIIAMHAPAAAPCETPIVEGEASGLPRELCRMQPQIPRTHPATNEHKVCGSLKLNSTIEALLSLLSAPDIKSIGDRFEEPTQRSIIIRVIIKIKTTSKAHHFLRESLLYTGVISIFKFMFLE